MSNDPIELDFCLMRSMSRGSMTLDGKYFCQNTHATFPRNIPSISCNVDDTLDRNQCKQFYEHVNESINSCEKVVSEDLKENVPVYCATQVKINCTCMLTTSFRACLGIAS